MDRSTTLHDVLSKAEAALNEGDIDGYWATLSPHSNYARLARDVSSDDPQTFLAELANTRLRRKFKDSHGRNATPEDLRALRTKIAAGDLAARSANLEKNGHIGVTSRQTVEYHAAAFKDAGLPPDTYLAKEVAEAVGPAWSRWFGAETYDAANPNPADSDASDASITDTAKSAASTANEGVDALIDAGVEVLPDAMRALIERRNERAEGIVDDILGPDMPDGGKDEHGEDSRTTANEQIAEVPTQSDAAAEMVARAERDAMDSDEDLLLKQPEQMTEPDIERLWRASVKHPDGHPLNRAFADQRTKAFERTFGTATAKTDATGRVVPPDAVRPFPDAPTPPTDAKGRDVKDAVVRTVRHIAETASDDVPDAVKALQTGLNLIERYRRFSADEDNAYAPFEPLNTDGAFGPKTHAALKRTAARSGAPKAREAFALGRFRELAAVAKENPDRAARLRPAVEREIGDLFPARTHEAAHSAPVRALQGALNDLNASAGEPERLKEDGVLGPITARVFIETAVRREPDEIAEGFGRGLGLLG